MKLLSIGVISVAVAFGVWQRSTLTDLRAEEARLSSEPVELKSGQTASAPQDASDAENSRILPFTDAEMTAFTAAILAVKEDFETNRWSKVSDENQLSHPILCETLQRLTSKQLRSILDAWPGGEANAKDRATGLSRFMLLAGKVNPSAAIPVMYELLKERGEEMVPGSPQVAFQHWFRHDPDGLLQWVRQAGLPDGFDGLAATWADTVLAAREPSVENVRKLVSHNKHGWDDWMRSEAVLKLPTQEARLTFFQSLHEATGGVADDIGIYVWQLADRVPFIQLAHLADETPAFKPSRPEGKTFDGFRDNEPRGSLRCEIAVRSRDGTAAERWAWLTKRAEDRPSGKLLGRLVKAWCQHDYPDTAAWVRALPPGLERDAVTKEVIAFLKDSGAAKLVPEWVSQ